MTIFQRGKRWHYEFETAGRRFRGACAGCSTREEALSFEKEIRRKVSALKAQKSVKALVENFRDELSGGRRISLEEAFPLATEKPVARKASKDWESYKRKCWEDFLAFMRGMFPSVRFLSDVTRSHCEAYVSHLRKFGRCAVIVRNRPAARPYSKGMSSLSAKTCNETQTAVSWVFSVLLEDAGLQRNPFAGIPKMKGEAVTREVFQLEEIQAILGAGDSFCRDVLAASLFTGLREGDVCNMRWESVDLRKGLLCIVQRKTRKPVTIPIMGKFGEMLRSLDRSSEYVFPSQHDLYERDPSGFSKRIRRFLESLGISTGVMADGRCRRSSTKDFHSCRHTFCWLAGQAGIPLPTVQAIVGHMTPEMTAHYAAHVTDAQKKAQIGFLEKILQGGEVQQSLTERVMDEIRGLPEDKLLEILEFIQSLK